MSLDSRGVLRGRCTACLCNRYDGGTEKKKCVGCTHPPGRHENLSTPTALTAPPPQATQQVHTQHMVTGRHIADSPESRSTRLSSLSPHSHSPALSAASSATPLGHYESFSPRYPWQPQLPMCGADGCTNPVWYESGLRADVHAFTYCSPECRDRHLLPTRRSQLKLELEQLKQELQRVAASEINRQRPAQQQGSQEQPSHQGQSNKPAYQKLYSPMQPVQQHQQSHDHQPQRQHEPGVHRPQPSNEAVVPGQQPAAVKRRPSNGHQSSATAGAGLTTSPTPTAVRAEGSVHVLDYLNAWCNMR